MTLYSLWESVGDVWILWICGAAMLTCLLARAAARTPWKTVLAFNRDQRGAAYALPYVLTFPVYLLVICTMVQATLILMAKIGNMYASYAAARAYIVWRPSDPTDADGLENGAYRAKRAAILAMTPFASGIERHRTELFPLFPGQLDLDDPLPWVNIEAILIDDELYAMTYEELVNYASGESGSASPIITNPSQPANLDYVKRKFHYAAAATVVEVPEDVTPFNQDVEVTVRYRMPIHIPGTGRIFGEGGFVQLFNPSVYHRDITTTVTLPSEAAKTDSGLLGIPYNPEFFDTYLGE